MQVSHIVGWILLCNGGAQELEASSCLSPTKEVSSSPGSRRQPEKQEELGEVLETEKLSCSCPSCYFVKYVSNYQLVTTAAEATSSTPSTVAVVPVTVIGAIVVTPVRGESSIASIAASAVVISIIPTRVTLGPLDHLANTKMLTSN